MASQDGAPEPTKDGAEPSVSSKPGGDAAGGGDCGDDPVPCCSAVDLLKRHLEQTQRLLAAQHDRAIQLLAARADRTEDPEGSIEKPCCLRDPRLRRRRFADAGADTGSAADDANADASHIVAGSNIDYAGAIVDAGTDPDKELGSRLAGALAEVEELRAKLAGRDSETQSEGARAVGTLTESAAEPAAGAATAPDAPAAEEPALQLPPADSGHHCSGASLESPPAAPEPPPAAPAPPKAGSALEEILAEREPQRSGGGEVLAPPRPRVVVNATPEVEMEPPDLPLPGQAEGVSDGCKSEDVNKFAVGPIPSVFSVSKKHFELLDVWVSMSHKFSGLVPAEKTSMQSTELALEEAVDEKKIMGVNAPTGAWRRVILHPYDTSRCIWDVLSMMLVLYDMVMIPMGFFDMPETSFLQAAAWTTRLFWTADMPLSFISGFVKKDGTIEMRPRGIARKYLSSWFPLDILVVGIDWSELLLSAVASDMGFARMGKASRVIRIMRMFRLLRLARVGEIINMLCERLPSERLVIFCDITKLMVIMISTGHLIACLWYAVGKESPADKNWIDASFMESDTLDLRYILSLRWALSQFAGGMDEVTPESFSEHLFAAWVYVTAFWSGAVFLSLLTSQMTQLYLLGSQQAQQLNVMRRYLAQNGVSKGLSLRVQRNAQHAMHSRQKAMPESAVTLVQMVSEPMRMELHFEMYSPGLTSHPFFGMYTKKCPYVVRRICHSAMSMSTNAIGDYIFHIGEISRAMLILTRGKLKYTWGDDMCEMLEPGSWICEPPLWVRWSHRGHLQSLEDSILFVFDAKAFQDIVTNFEGTSLNPVGYARSLVSSMNSTDDLSDLPINLPDTTWRKAPPERSLTKTLLTGGGRIRASNMGSYFRW